MLLKEHLILLLLELLFIKGKAFCKDLVHIVFPKYLSAVLLTANLQGLVLVEIHVWFREVGLDQAIETGTLVVVALASTIIVVLVFSGAVAALIITTTSVVISALVLSAASS